MHGLYDQAGPEAVQRNFIRPAEALGNFLVHLPPFALGKRSLAPGHLLPGNIYLFFLLSGNLHLGFNDFFPIFRSGNI